MIYLTTFLYYIFFASSISIYGIGLNKTADVNFWDNKDVFYFIKIILTILISSVISWFICDKILVPLKIAQLYPLFCFIIYVCISLITESVFSAVLKKTPTEFIVSYLTIILSVSESTSLINTIVISSSIIISMLLFIPFVHSFRKRNLEDVSKPEVYMTRLFIFFAVLILIISCWDIMWINPEVLK